MLVATAPDSPNGDNSRISEWAWRPHTGFEWLDLSTGGRLSDIDTVNSGHPRWSSEAPKDPTGHRQTQNN